MKKTLIPFLAFALVIASSCEKETVLEANDIPAEIETFVATHFDGQSIIQVTRERDDLRKSYEVLLDNYASLEFNGKKEITSVEAGEKLPDSVIPESVIAYVLETYPDNFIVAWELDDRRQQVELDHGIELEFSRDGKFIKIDD